MQNSSDRSVFILLVGGYGNIGDALIRRRSLEWFREFGPVHAYVGSAPDHWLVQMGLVSTDSIYSSSGARSWIWQLARGGRNKVLVFDPGEVLLTRRQIPKELGFLFLTLLCRVTGGKVVRNPRAIRDPNRVCLAIHQLACRMSSLVMWRESKSIRAMKVGVLVPDIGFSEPLYGSLLPERERNLLFVSMRGLRAELDEVWYEGLSSFAQQHGLDIVVGSQVREDEVRSREIARRLDCEFLEWGSRTDLEQEQALKEKYSRSRIVVSDRMHVLVFAVLGGAIPLEIVGHPVPKIADHFGQIGILDISFDCSHASVPEVVDFLQRNSGRRQSNAEAIAVAQSDLVLAQKNIVDVLQ